MEKVYLGNSNARAKVAEVASYRVAALARHFQVSVRQLERYSRTNLGTSTKNWLDVEQMRRARALLEEQDIRSIKLVAFELGFKQYSHFSKKFKDHHGVTPFAFFEHISSKASATRAPATTDIRD